MTLSRYALRAPQSDSEWAEYHRLRRTILFERRGRFAVYDPTHPDEHRADNHPFLLFIDDMPVGTVRIDIGDDDAVFRLVTIREDLQRLGYGRRMLSLAEGFVREQRRSRIHSHVNPDAVLFYERCGFVRVGPGEATATILMRKDL
ncbi:MAG TPA: GNAT family N-acetyltransferase [Gemmatimonadaceae bacterium]|nr:GNAT family N-acetyltransferase [Gemmatimonadaceae bacterium]